MYKTSCSRFNFYLCLIFIFKFSIQSLGQEQKFSIHPIKLPPEIEEAENQFSGLFINYSSLYLLSESRIWDGYEAKMYAIGLTDIELQLEDSLHEIIPSKIDVLYLDKISARIKQNRDVYEGLEAFCMDRNTVYFLAETGPKSPNCYLLKGEIVKYQIRLDSNFLIALEKPKTKDNQLIPNAGFESILLQNDTIFAFYECNTVDTFNYVSTVDLKTKTIDKKRITSLPYRLTDLTFSDSSVVGINLFYKGANEAYYRNTDTLIQTNEKYHNYSRLVALHIQKNQFEWQVLWEFPQNYWGYNWEGIASYKSGYFIINDKYTAEKPYRSELIYLKPE